MIIESKIKATNSDVLIDDYSLCSIEENNGNGTTIWLYGKTTPTIIIKPFEEMKKIFIDSKKRDRLSGEEKSQCIKKPYDVVKVDENCFSVNITQMEWKGEVTKSLEIHANFKLKNEVLKNEVEDIIGVEEFNNFSFSKYKCSVSIGSLFDIETIRDQVEQKFIEYLSL